MSAVVHSVFFYFHLISLQLFAPPPLLHARAQSLDQMQSDSKNSVLFFRGSRADRCTVSGVREALRTSSHKII